MLDGERYDIKAALDSIGGYSALADQAWPVKFETGMRQGRAKVRLVHGEPNAKKQLSHMLHALYQNKGQRGDTVIPGS